MVAICSKYKFCVLFVCLFFGTLSVLFAQRLPLPDILTVDDGLSFRHVSAIAQDEMGLMWFGTTNGLSRYDGYRFVNFGEETVADKYFPALDFAQNGMLFHSDSMLWAIADHQLWSMNTHNFHTRQVVGLEGKVLKLIAGKNKDIWLVSGNDVEQMLWRFTEESGFGKVATVPHLGLEFTDIEVDTSGALWWSTVTKGLLKISPTGQWINETKIDSFLWNGQIIYYNHFFIDSQNRFFVYSMNIEGDNQVWQYFPESQEKKVLVGGMNDFFFLAAEDSGGNIWFTKENGLLQLQPDGFLNDYTDAVHEVLDFTKIFSIFEDYTNTLWMGTDGGLLKLPVRKQFFDNYFSRKNVGWGNAMRGICEGPGDDLYFFCETGDFGLHRMNRVDGQIEKLRFRMNESAYFSRFELANYLVFDQKRNCLWTMTETLLKIDLQTQQVIPQPAISYGRESSSFNPVALLPDGQILLGNQLDKLALYDPESGRLNNLLAANAQAFVDIVPKTFLVQGNDSLWVGTINKGLYLFDRNGNLLQHFHKGSQPALNNNHVICLYFDQKSQQLWAGTFGGGMSGINLQTGKVQVFNQQNGLADKSVASILGDEENLWIGTFNGLSCLNKNENTFQNYFAEDGLTHNEFNFSSAFKTKDGQLFFGGLNGINAFYPQDLLQQMPNPPLQLTRFTKYDQRLDSLFDVQLTGRAIPPITISPAISFFTFEWTLPNYSNPDKNQYFTWLEGLEPNWTFLGNTPSIRFNKLPPGYYTLHLKGKDSRGNWSEQPIDLNLHVVTPWWKRWWAFCLYFLLSAVVIGFFRRRELRRIYLQNQLEKNNLEAVSLRELDQAKSRFFANISHEFRTPLTVILGMTAEIEGPDIARQLIQQSGQNLLRLVNQILDLGKLEAGKLELQPRPGDLVSYLQYLLESFRSLSAHKNVQLFFDSDVPNLDVAFDEEKMQHIISNLLSNAVKFTARNGRVTLSLTANGPNRLADGVPPDAQSPAFIVISVSDTGIGIPAEQLPRIFERYFQVKHSLTEGEPGSGIGLAFTKELVELMGGSITVESKVGVGTVVSVSLPASFQSSSREEEPIPVAESLSAAPVNLIQVPSPAFSDEAGGKPETKGRLLVIEDNPEVVIYIQAILQNEYDITIAENGAIGIEMAIAQIPDIIISDVMMPLKDGYAVTRFLKNDERTSHIPIILLTARADAKSRLIGLERGADAYLAKPFDKKELLIRLEQLVLLRKKLQTRYTQFTRLQPTRDVGLQLEDAFLQKVNNIITAHLSEAEFGVTELCLEAGLSQSQLFRKLKALTGKSSVAYLRSLRLHEAKIMLKKGEMNISEVAYATGFNDPKYFSRVYSQEFGHTPTDAL